MKLEIRTGGSYGRYFMVYDADLNKHVATIRSKEDAELFVWAKTVQFMPWSMPRIDGFADAIVPYELGGEG